jgi:hypothetical protein
MLAHSALVVMVVPAMIGVEAVVPGNVAHAQSCGQLLNHQGAGSVACPCFVVGEEAGATFTVPAADYPIEILKIGIGWGSQFGGAPASLEQAIHLYAGGLPNPGAPQFSLLGPLFNDGFINTFDISQAGGNRIINGGPFTITVEFLNQNAGNVFAPSVTHDGNGCIPGQNVVKAIPGGWNDACLLGVTGDWVVTVEYRSVNITPLNCPAGDGTGTCAGSPNRSPDINSDAVVDLIDLAVFAPTFTSPPNPYAQCNDINNDGLIDLVDLALFATHWGHAGVPGFCN